jgi:hypothetical protein
MLKSNIAEPAVSTPRASSNGVMSLFREHRFGGEMTIIQIAVRLKRLALHAAVFDFFTAPGITLGATVVLMR